MFAPKSLLVREHGRSSGILLLLLLFVCGSSRVKVWHGLRGPARTRSDGLVHPLAEVMLCSQAFHRWLLRDSLPLEDIRSKLDSSTPLPGGRHKAIQPWLTCFASTPHCSRATVDPQRCFLGMPAASLLQSMHPAFVAGP